MTVPLIFTPHSLGLGRKMESVLEYEQISLVSQEIPHRVQSDLRDHCTKQIPWKRLPKVQIRSL